MQPIPMPAQDFVQTRLNFIQYNQDYSSQITLRTCHKAVNVLTSVRPPKAGKRLFRTRKARYDRDTLFLRAPGIKLNLARG